MDTALEDAQACFQTSWLSSLQLQTHVPWRHLLVVSPFLSSSDLWRPNAMGAGTMLEAAFFDCRHLFKNNITSAWSLKSSGWLFSPTWNIPRWAYGKQANVYLFLHFNFSRVGGEKTSQKQNQIKVTTNFNSSKLCKVVKRRGKNPLFLRQVASPN